MVLKFLIAKQILKKSDELEITLQRSSSFDGPIFWTALIGQSKNRKTSFLSGFEPANIRYGEATHPT